MERRAHKRGLKHLKHMDTHGYKIMNHDEYMFS